MYTRNILSVWLPFGMLHVVRDWSLITGRGGLQNGKKSRVRNFLHPPTQDGKSFRAPPFKEWKLHAPPLQYGSNFKLPRKNYPKTFCAPPFRMAKTFPPPPVGVKLHVPPPLPFCSPPPPLPVINDQSLRCELQGRCPSYHV